MRMSLTLGMLVDLKTSQYPPAQVPRMMTLSVQVEVD